MYAGVMTMSKKPNKKRVVTLRQARKVVSVVVLALLVEA
jgi:hypothetical protein